MVVVGDKRQRFFTQGSFARAKLTKHGSSAASLVILHSHFNSTVFTFSTCPSLKRNSECWRAEIGRSPIGTMPYCSVNFWDLLIQRCSRLPAEEILGPHGDSSDPHSQQTPNVPPSHETHNIKSSKFFLPSICFTASAGVFILTGNFSAYLDIRVDSTAPLVDGYLTAPLK